MKTNCGTCRKTSVNLLHKESGTAYCSNCGTQMILSVVIVNQLSKLGLFLPDDIFDEPAPKPAVHTPQSAQAATSAPRRHTPGTGPQDPFAAAAARREKMHSNLVEADNTNGDGRPGFRSGRKISREEAAAEKEAIRASLRAQAGAAYEPITNNSTPPDIRQDLREAGVDIERIDRIERGTDSE